MKTFYRIAILVMWFFISLTSFTSFESKEASTLIVAKPYNNKDVIEGLYVLKTCENGRFSIRVVKKDALYTFHILDSKKSISRGKVSVEKEGDNTYLSFGKIGGIWKGNSIQVQNYGNSMNEYNHFTQCEDKYLTFEK
jgi:hypothetical protein